MRIGVKLGCSTTTWIVKIKRFHMGTRSLKKSIIFLNVVDFNLDHAL